MTCSQFIDLYSDYRLEISLLNTTAYSVFSNSRLIPIYSNYQRKYTRFFILNEDFTT